MQRDPSARVRTQVPPPHGAVSVAHGWGWFPALSLIAAAGLVAVSVSYALVGAGLHAAEPLFWMGLLLVAAPITLRLAAAAPGIRERVGLLLVLGLMLQLVQIVRSPTSFTGYDELLHLRTLTDIVSSGHLFTRNPLLLVSPLFPSLEIITAAVVQLSGAEPHTAAIVVLLSVRTLFSVGLFALYREASSSERIAGLAAAIYMLGPNFTFFDSAFSYETLGLPLVPILLLITAIRAKRQGGIPMLVALAAVAAMLAITHHVTMLVSTAIFVAWLVVQRIERRRDRYRGLDIAVATALVAGAAAIWLVVVAPIVVSYLAGPISNALSEAIRLVTTLQGRVPFQSATGQLAPVWERAAGLGTAALLTFGIVLGLLPLIRRYRDSSLAMLLGVIALAYPASLLGRLTPTGSEAAGRSLGFVFLGLGFVVAIGVVAVSESLAGRVRRMRDPVRGTLRGSPARSEPAWKAAFVVVVVVTILGGAVIGAAPATRFPGPYLVSADTRSIDNESTTAATWARELLGPHRRIAADRVNRLLMGAYGQADVVFEGSVGIQTWQIFLSTGVGPAEVARLKDAGLEYLVIDRRLSSSLPLVPFYYEEAEILEGKHTTPVALSILEKWAAVAQVDRIYDSGDIALYDVRRLSGAP